jgi:uncharacterized membrane protein HdeD (DUF308 family)
MIVNGFLIGVIATASMASGVFFLKFWRNTRDNLFLAFALAFIIEAVNRTAVLTLQQPNEGRTATYIVRCLAFLLIVAGIINKNRQART